MKIMPKGKFNPNNVARKLSKEGRNAKR